MNSETLNRLLSAVNEFDASDLHLVAGVPPAFGRAGDVYEALDNAGGARQAGTQDREPRERPQHHRGAHHGERRVQSDDENRTCCGMRPA